MRNLTTKRISREVDCFLTDFPRPYSQDLGTSHNSGTRFFPGELLNFPRFGNFPESEPMNFPASPVSLDTGKLEKSAKGGMNKNKFPGQKSMPGRHDGSLHALGRCAAMRVDTTFTPTTKAPITEFNTTQNT